MYRILLIFIILALSSFIVVGRVNKTVIADAVTHRPLPSASIFDRQGNIVGISDSRGIMPFIPSNVYPVTVRYLGFKEETVPSMGRDTIFLSENVSELPEVIVESRQHKVLHMLAYVREYSNLTTYRDTVFLFREKMVDYMLTPDKKMKFKGWSTPRVLTCRSYYRFTNSDGLDSVSDRCNHHFSWSDWIGAAPVAQIPGELSGKDVGVYTLKGKYGPVEVWTKNEDRITVDINVLADSVGRKWVPNLSGFFRNDLDFERFKVRFKYRDIISESVDPSDLTGYSINIESYGRGHDMFRFNKVDEPFFVNTYAEVYVMDKEYVTVKEAKMWDKCKFNTDEIGIYKPRDVPELHTSIVSLIARVNNIDSDKIRLEIAPDDRLIGKNNGNRNFQLGHRALTLLKQITGIASYKSNKNINRRWNEFKKGLKRKDDAN